MAKASLSILHLNTTLAVGELNSKVALVDCVKAGGALSMVVDGPPAHAGTADASNAAPARARTAKERTTGTADLLAGKWS
jgi:hypothetical protein